MNALLGRALVAIPVQNYVLNLTVAVQSVYVHVISAVMVQLALMLMLELNC